MRITREMLDRLNACAVGVDDFIERFPDGADSDEVLEYAKQCDETRNDNVSRTAFVRMLRGNYNELSRVNVRVLPTGTFHVFDPLTGGYITSINKELAAADLEKVINNYFHANTGMFNAMEECEAETGTVMRPLEVELSIKVVIK